MVFKRRQLVTCVFWKVENISKTVSTRILSTISLPHEKEKSTQFTRETLFYYEIEILWKESPTNSAHNHEIENNLYLIIVRFEWKTENKTFFFLKICCSFQCWINFLREEILFFPMILSPFEEFSSFWEALKSET